MNTQPPDLGPTFHTVKRKKHPSTKVHDLGIEMRWGKPRVINQIYWNALPNAPYNFRLEHALVYEGDVSDGIQYKAIFACKTRVGLFISLTNHLANLYDLKLVNRNIFAVLREVDALLPTFRVTEKTPEAAIRLGPRVVATGIFVAALEDDGFRLTDFVEGQDCAMLSIGWLHKRGGRHFTVGGLNLRLTASGIVGEWRSFGGARGVDNLLQREFEKRCKGFGACLTPAGRKQCLAHLPPVRRTKAER